MANDRGANLPYVDVVKYDTLVRTGYYVAARMFVILVIETR